MQTAHLAFLIAYFVLMIATGVYFSRRSKVASGEDFMFAGRRLPRIVLIGTLLATWVGSGTIIGGANFAYTYGLGAYFFFIVGTPVGIVLLYLIAKKIRSAAGYTIPELLEARYGLAVRMVSAVVVLLAYVGIAAYQFTGGGYILSLVTPLSVLEGTIVTAVLVTFLAVSGGLSSVAWTDFMSAVIIVVSLVVAVPFAISRIGSFGDYWDGLPELSTTATGGLTPMQLLGYFLPLFLLIIADQNLYQRLAASSDQSAAKRSTLGFLIGAIIVIVPVALLATAASVLMPAMENPDMAVLSLATEGYVPTVVGGLFLAAGLGFIVTTGTSFLLSVGGNITYDFYLRHAKREVGDAERLRLHRFAVLGVAALAFVLVQFFPTVLELQIHSYTVYGVAIAPIVLAAFFWKRVTAAGALACMIVGTAAVLVWEFALDKPLDWNSVLVAFPLALIALVGVSLVTKPRTIADTETQTVGGATP